MLKRNWQQFWRSTPVEAGRQTALAAAAVLLRSAVAQLLRFLIRAYQCLLSPLLGPACRFHPSCSSYAIQAIDRYGPLRGTALALARLSRCHPLSEGGFDPVR